MGSNGICFASAFPSILVPHAQTVKDVVTLWQREMFSYMTDINISDKVMPLNIEDPLQAPLVDLTGSCWLHI